MSDAIVVPLTNIHYFVVYICISHDFHVIFHIIVDFYSTCHTSRGFSVCLVWCLPSPQQVCTQLMSCTMVVLAVMRIFHFSRPYAI